MTIEEAIKTFKGRKALAFADGYADQVQDYIEAMSMAVDALRAQQERENQKPLTLDDLQKMDGQPVWCVYPDCDTGGEWFICDKNENEVSKNKYGLPFRYYGEWTAYRYQPKKEAQK